MPTPTTSCRCSWWWRWWWWWWWWWCHARPSRTTAVSCIVDATPTTMMTTLRRSLSSARASPPYFDCVLMDGGTTKSTFETSTSNSSGVGDNHGRLSNILLSRDGCNALHHLDGIVAIADLPLATVACEKEFVTQCCNY